jgi:hypothetical protein
MKLSDGRDSFELRFVEFGQDQNGEPTEIRLDVRVTSRGFSGTNDRVWVFRDSFDRFVDALQTVDRNRKGEALLSSMSLDDLRLWIGAIDGAGHIGLQGWVGCVVIGSRQESVGSRVGFGFELDSSSFSGHVREISSMVPNARTA